MNRVIIFFEDQRTDDFFPLNLSHTSFDLKCGIFSLAEKWSRRLEHSEIRLLSRDHLAGYLAYKHKLKVNDLVIDSVDQVVFINPCFLPEQKLVDQILCETEERTFHSGSDFIALVIPGKSKKLKAATINIDTISDLASELPAIEVDQKPLRYLWDLVSQNGREIKTDFELIRSGLDFKRMFDHCEVDDTALIYNLESVYLGTGGRIDGHVVLDARQGPIYVAENVYIAPHTRVEGPAYIGPDCQLVGGKIRAGCSFGPHCRVGGEVEESIFHGYSNKYHEGFIGHTYLGEWINLGALTTNSDLKNNYGNVKVELPSGLIDTGLTKVGSFIGDHSKTGIGTLLNTGMVLGFSVNLYGGGLVTQRLLPSFVWGSRDGFSEYQLEKAIETARVVLSRRGVKFYKQDKRLFEMIFKSTAHYRAGL